MKASEMVRLRAEEWDRLTGRRTAEYHAERERLEPQEVAWESRRSARGDGRPNLVHPMVQEAAMEYRLENVRSLGIMVELYKMATELEEAGL